jgi:hypothetical protein
VPPVLCSRVSILPARHLANSRHNTMIIYDHRPPVVKDHLVKAAIVMAYAYANSHNRAKYASLFPAFPAMKSLSPPTEPGEQGGAVRLQQRNDPKDPFGDEDGNKRRHWQRPKL